MKEASFIEINKKITKFINDLYLEMTHNMDPDDQICTAIFHPSLDIPISIGFMNLEDFTPQLLENEISKVCQSKRALRIDQTLEIKCKIAKIMKGSGLPVHEDDDMMHLNTLFKTKRSVKRIVQPKDHLCALRAFLVAKHYVDHDIKSVRNVLRGKNRLLESETADIARSLGFDNSRPLGLSDIAKLEWFFKDYQVTVYDHNSRFTSSKHPVYRGPLASKFIYLLLFKRHFWPIVSPKAFFETRSFCHFCKSATNHIEFHNCEYICAICKRADCKQTTASYIKCENCGFNCRNEGCLRAHSLFCKARRICEHCGFKYVYLHQCQVVETKYCVNCKDKVKLDHRCYMQKGALKAGSKLQGYIFFDFEASQETGFHIANLAIAHVYDRSFTLVGKKYFYNSGNSVQDMFCNWLFQNKNYIAIAHNLKGYDGIFIMNYLLNNLVPGTEPPRVLNQGNKILTITYNDVKLIDSYLFLPMPLNDFSQTFGLAETKGYFPHLFNTLANQEYNAARPEPFFYGYENMSEEKQRKFLSWYDVNKHQPFNFKDEFYSYCERDVDLLAKGCIAFDQIIYESTRINPFIQCITLASLCHTIYRHKNMPTDSIAIIPELGYNPRENTSRKAQLWLKYLAEAQKINIKHAKNGGEHKISPYRVDGYCEDDDTVYEFHGCLYHGCLRCFSPRTNNPFRQETMEKTRQRHCDRIEFLKKHCNRIVEMWECEWDAFVSSDERAKDFVKNNPIRSTINPREALFGGRTNAAKLYHRVEGNEKIEYLDICSLYPHVMEHHEYPVGHPTIITENFRSPENYFGLIKCKILPPRNLYFPVLPVKLHHKLIFPLCLACAEELNTKKQCVHVEEERCLQGVWCTPEIRAALEYGYKIVQIYEVWHWQNRSVDLFRGYIRNFLKIKQESSGYPSWVTTEEQKEEYIEGYYKKEHVRLDPTRICKNSGLRKIAKLLLNTLWGRFGMNLNKSRIEIISNRDEWFTMLADENFVIHDVQESNPEILQVVYSERADMHLGGNQTNVPIAAFVTSYARVKLFRTLVKLDRRVLYFDTDSVIFVSDEQFRRSPNFPVLGDYLGEWTDECSDGRLIIVFISCGAKNYALYFDDGNSECVIKGIQQTNIFSERVNFETMKEILLQDQKKTILVPQSRIKINKKSWHLVNTDVDKEYNMVYDKRILNQDFSSRPYGYLFVNLV